MNMDYDEVKAYWGEVPDWVVTLAEACAVSSQRKVARTLNYSQTTISQVLRNCYLGDLSSVESHVRQNLMGIKAMENKQTTLDDIMTEVLKTFCSLARFKLQALEADEPLNFALICDAEKKLISAHNDLNDVSF